MRLVLPGGAVLDDEGRGGVVPKVAYRPLAGVVEGARVARAAVTEPATTGSPPPPQVAEVPPAAVASAPVVTPAAAAPDQAPPKAPERLATLKLVLEILVVLVGLIGALLALFGVSQK